MKFNTWAIDEAPRRQPGNAILNENISLNRKALSFLWFCKYFIT